MKRLILILACILTLQTGVRAQKYPSKAQLQEMCDTLQARLDRRFLTKNEIKVSKTLKRGDKLDIYFTADAAYYPWHESDHEWFRGQVEKELKGITRDFKLGEIYARNHKLDEYCTHGIGNDGRAHSYGYATKDPRTGASRFISRGGARVFPRGLSDRYIAVWQSHGYFYDDKQNFWRFQRAPLFRTVEDMFTQSFVLPFLIPMLENSGAYVLTPRERDINPLEYVVDNDKSFSTVRPGMLRKTGKYAESGSWKSAGPGFADYKESYGFNDNIFSAGSARMTRCTPSATASVTWTPDISKRGTYAVYISYKTIDHSATTARYTVHHMGGDTEFQVNQRRGGGTWIYLGTFEFDGDGSGYVKLDNRGKTDEIVTADAVRFGGGMGKVSRGGSVSGVKSYIEGALYSEVWAGADSTITRAWSTEYIDEYSTRGAWTDWMHTKKNIPFDLSLAFHTDAGIVQNDSIVGTLAIYTRTSEGKVTFADGRDRVVSRQFCDNVQSQVVQDLRAEFDPLWTRRGIWDKSYNESRTPNVPAMILELMSHQNFNDMKLGLDPSFRFTVSRAVYKGILKTLSDFYGCPYTVQPLPVNSFSVRFGEDGKAVLSWKPTEDRLEPTAKAKGYTVYTRIDDGVFDSGREFTGNSAEIPIKDGHIYSFKVEAWNDGGRSFPSEVLAIGRPSGTNGGSVLIVNNFDRVSAPSWVDTPNYAGFNAITDSGVPYIRDINYIGDTYEFNPEAEYIDDDYSGFGSSYTDRAGDIIAGNTFDYPYIHGKALMALGRPFFSCSRDAFCDTGAQGAAVIDLLCGKQKTTIIGPGRVPDRYQVFTDELREAIVKAGADGVNFIVNGANIASDRSSDPVVSSFVADNFGYKVASAFGTRTGMIAGMPFHSRINPDFYCVECPDGLNPEGRNARTLYRYTGSNVSAAVSFQGRTNKSVSVGIPLETLKEDADRLSVFRTALEYFDRDSKPVNHR